jgi:hypothetical protein
MTFEDKRLLREQVRKIARKIKGEQKQQLREELKLRRYIRQLIREVEEVSPHESTGINVLEDLLKTIVPILESGYKRLTTDVSQRKSFRAHVLRAIQNLLSTESIYFKADKNGSKNTALSAPVEEPAAELTEADEEEAEAETGAAGAEVEEDPAFIDIEKDKKEKEAKKSEPKPEDAFTPIAGEDPTGRGFALRSFQKIQKQILDSYSLLGKDEDRETFYDYLITNTKLYFDKFEDELQKGNLEEPTTPEYEEEKKRKAQALGTAGIGSGPETPVPEIGAGEEGAEEEEEATA